MHVLGNRTNSNTNKKKWKFINCTQTTTKSPLSCPSVCTNIIF